MRELLTRSIPLLAAIGLLELSGCGGAPDAFSAAEVPASHAAQADDNPGRGAAHAAILKSCQKKAAGDVCTVEDAGRSFQGVCTSLPLDAGLACLEPPSICPACGNGIREAGEACDDGNRVNGDGCDNNCTVTSCGNGVVSAGEQCDDGNRVNGDGCDNNCTPTRCGNGVLTAGEQCDDGNSVNGDGCDNNCTPTGCGNGIVTGLEQCDDGNFDNNDGCTNTCQFNCHPLFCGP